jgi:translation initiation factor IF-3
MSSANTRDNSSKRRRNNEIKALQVMVIDAGGEPLGVMNLRDAIEKAERQGLDLVEIAANQTPPVCKIADYGALSYQESKKQHEARAKQREQEVKEIRLRPNTDDGDLAVKAKQMAQFLERGAKVKVLLRFRGREVTHANLGFEQFERLKELVGELAVVETPPKMEGRQLHAMIAPSKKARDLARASAQRKADLAAKAQAERHEQEA